MPKILIIDDEADMRLSLRQLFEKLGYEIFEAAEGKAALARLAEIEVDLVLLDLRLPDMDGLEILAHVRHEHQDLAVIVLSGFGDEETLSQIKLLGADCFFVKPFHNRDLAAAAARILQSRSLRKSPLLYEKRLAQKLEPEFLDKSHWPGPSSKMVRPAPAQPKKTFLFWLGLGILACAVVFGFLSFQARPGFYTLDSENLTALAWVQNQLWVADWLKEEIVRYGRQGGRFEIGARRRFPGFHITGLAFGAEALYSCDSWTKTIRRHYWDGALSVALEKASPGGNPSCLFYEPGRLSPSGAPGSAADGRAAHAQVTALSERGRLWSCDAASGRLYAHDPKHLTVMEFYDSGVLSPIGFYKKGNEAWVLDAQTGFFHKLFFKETPKISGVYSLPEVMTSESPLSAFTIKGRNLWFAYDGRDQIFRIPLSRLRLRH